MGRVPGNIIANAIGQGWTAAVALLLVPVYVRLLGVEAYGLVGVYATLQASLQILDLGFGQTTNRQVARYLAFPEQGREIRDFVRTVEAGYWLVGLVAGGTIAAAAPFIARSWLHVGALPLETTIHAVRTMGLVTALQWPLTFYSGVLMGLQRQVGLNVLKVVTATVAGVGSLIVLLYLSPTITAYFAWQSIAAAAGVAAFAVAAWRCLPPASGPSRFRPGIVLGEWRLAAGMGGIAASAVVLSQLDKILLSKLLPLETFGYYALASVVAAAIPLLVAGPVFTAVFPRLTTLAAMHSKDELSLLYHRGAQLLAILTASAGGVLAGFSREVMHAWTRNAETAAVTAPLVSLLALGMMANALAVMPYALQLAHGWTGLAVRINVLLMAVLVPGIFVLANRFGPAGAACAWAVVNVAYLCAVVPLTHRRLLRGEATAVVQDVLPPIVAAGVVVGGARSLLSFSDSLVANVARLGGVGLLALGAAAASAPLIRRGVLDALARGRAAMGR